MAKQKKKSSDLAKNKKAYFQYEILEKIEAGIELKGTEVKSCREHSIAMTDAYVKIENGEAWLLNVNIAPYKYGNQFNHSSVRPRKLLLHKREILKLANKIREKGLTVIPLKFYLKNGKVKVLIGVGKGKTFADKRETLKKRQHDMDAKRSIR
jgi:SsrA-binding protein